MGKPRRTTTKKKDRPKITKSEPSVRVTEGKKRDVMPISKPTSTKPKAPPGRPTSGLHKGYSGRVDPGLAAAVSSYQPPISDVQDLGSVPKGGIVDIGYGAGQIDPKLAAAVGPSGLVQGDPWVSTSGWKPPERITEGGEMDGKIPPIDDDDEEDKKKQYDAIEYFWDEENNRWDIRKANQPKNLAFLQRLTGRKIANITADGKIIFADEVGGEARFMKLADALNQLGAKWTGFDPTKALTEGGMGDQGKAALWNKLNDMSPGEFQDFLNRKGNLDRIMEFAGQGAAGGPSPDFDMNKLKSGGREYLMSLLESTASGSAEDFQSLKDKNSSKKSDRERYWKNNPPRTQGDLEEAAMSGITWIEGYGPVEKPEGQLSQGIGGIGGGGGGVTPTDPTTDPTTTKVPDYVLKQQYMPGFTPSYTGGPEQMHIAGGYWDPVAKKWIGQGPWGTQGQYQFPPQTPTMAQGGIVGTSPLLFKNQGGMVNDNGIKAFKKYGY